MGHMTVTIPKTSVEQRVALVKNLTETVANVLGLPHEVRRRISVRIDMYESQEVARDGRMIDVKQHPLSHIEMYSPTIPYDRKRELVRHLTTALCETLGYAPEQRDEVFITFHQFRPEDIATGGHLVAELAMA